MAGKIEWIFDDHRSFFFKPMEIYQENLSQLFKAFVKNADVRSDVLRWIGDCLSENQGE